MSLATTYSRAILGVEAVEVRVETHLSNGLPGFAIVGLPETAVKLAVLAVVSQFTVPVRPNPDCVAPAAKATAAPLEPIVILDPHLEIIIFPEVSFTSFVLKDAHVAIAKLSPLSPRVTVPQFVLGLILFTFTSLIIFYLLKFISYNNYS